VRCLKTKVLGANTSGWRPFSKEHDPLRRLSDDGKCPGFSNSPHRSRGGLKGDLGRLKRPGVLQTYSRNSGFGDSWAHGSVRVGLRTAACVAGSRVPGRYSRRFGRQAGLQKGSVLVPLASPHFGEDRVTVKTVPARGSNVRWCAPTSRCVAEVDQRRQVSEKVGGCGR
jgi:hypothetical protein